MKKVNGIRKNNVGEWLAFVNGELVKSCKGPGSKAEAIKAAGTNHIITDKELSKHVA